VDLTVTAIRTICRLRVNAIYAPTRNTIQPRRRGQYPLEITPRAGALQTA
jgi:hypothetical protein